MYSLTNLKSKGCLIIPAQDVINICIICERLFRKNVTCGDGSLSRIASHKIVQSVMKHFLYKPCFENLSCHMFDTEPDMNHAVLLLKAISEKYLQVRYHYAGKQYTASLQSKQKKISRQVNTKLIIFSGL